MVVIINNGSLLYRNDIETRAESIVHVKEVFGTEVAPVSEPQAIVLADKPYLIVFSATIPEYLHIREEFRNATVYVTDDFSYYPDKVREYYASFTKDVLLKELLRYKVGEVADGNVGAVI